MSQIKTLMKRRVTRLASAVLAAVAVALSTAVASGAPASAATIPYAGAISCSAGRVTVNAPTMYAYYSGDDENAEWMPHLQVDMNGYWYNVRNGTVYGNYLVHVIIGGRLTGTWNNISGAPVGSAISWNVTPGYYYRVVNYYAWTDLNNSLIAGWWGPYASPWSVNSYYQYCAA